MIARAVRLWPLCWVLCLVTLAGCLSSGREASDSLPADVAPSYTLAILPFTNETNSVSGALYLRQVIQEKIVRKGYSPRPLSEVDQILSDQFGISLGGQIDDSAIPEIGLALGVDAVMTGVVHRFGIAVSDLDDLDPNGEVEGTLRLFDTATGKQIWEGHKKSQWDRGAHPLPGDQKAVYSLGADLLLNLAFTAFGKPLFPVVETFCDSLIGEMPRRDAP